LLRVEYINQFRHQHDQLVETLKVSRDQQFSEDSKNRSLLGWESCDQALGQIQVAIEGISSIDSLDVSSDGVLRWNQAEALYNTQIASIEHDLIGRLRELLGKSSSASEMFSLFSKFNALFIRPKIRGAIHEYQVPPLSLSLSHDRRNSWNESRRI
jgi:dynein heavy chain 1